MNRLGTCPILARILTETRDILVRESEKLTANDKSRLPIGELIDAMVQTIEADQSWGEVAWRVDDSRDAIAEHRRFMDGDRRKKKRRARSA